MADEHTQDPRHAEPRPPYPKQKQRPPGKESEMRPPPDYGEQTYVGHGRLKDKVALITGADSGIGRAVALAFAREGADVAIAYLSEHEDAQHTKDVVEKSGRRALLLPGDIASDDHCRKIIDETVEQFGRVDILVNNAAHQPEAVERFEDIDPERVERSFRVNIMAMYYLVRHALPHMTPGSTIINVSSIEAYQPSPPILDYSGTKGAIITFTKGLAHALVERGIRVNCVAPGAVWTPLIPQSFPPEKVAKHGTSAPMERAGQPAELAPAFVFLASDESRYVTGEVLGVTGGRLLA